jgi:hypothetical protein
MPYVSTGKADNKPDRSELTSVLTGANYAADGTSVTGTYITYNALTKTTKNLDVMFPLASTTAAGAMTKEAYNSLTEALTDIAALQQQGGRFIGVSFATKADLTAWTVPAWVNVGDFTYVLDDEDHSDATTRYILTTSEEEQPVKAFTYAYTINYDPIGFASATVAGLVLSSTTDGNDGKVFVEMDGSMSVIGWSALKSVVAGKVVSPAGTLAKPAFLRLPTGYAPGAATDTVNTETIGKWVTFSSGTFEANLKSQMPQLMFGAIVQSTVGNLPSGVTGTCVATYIMTNPGVAGCGTLQDINGNSWNYRVVGLNTDTPAVSWVQTYPEPWGLMNWTPNDTQSSTVSETSLPMVGTAASSDFADISADGYITFKKAGRYMWYFGRMDMLPISDNLWSPGLTSLTGGVVTSNFTGTPRMKYTEWGLGALNNPVLIRSPAGGGARIMWSWCDAVMSWTFTNVAPCQLFLTGNY